MGIIHFLHSLLSLVYQLLGERTALCKLFHRQGCYVGKFLEQITALQNEMKKLNKGSRSQRWIAAIKRVLSVC
ncbi:hypothetical protein Btaycd_005290 [Bartonella taylorii]|nr:hypothetical protein Btaycd_005290 [Bartonella taylorii]